MDYGDHIVPIVDINSKFQNPKGERDTEDVSFLWTEYTWNADYFGMSRMGMDAVEVASAGFGAAANSFMDFVNVKEEDNAKYTVPDSIHRSKDPEAGAFTYHHSRGSSAQDHILAGQELFVSYGDKWYVFGVSLIRFLGSIRAQTTRTLYSSHTKGSKDAKS